MAADHKARARLDKLEAALEAHDAHHDGLDQDLVNVRKDLISVEAGVAARIATHLTDVDSTLDSLGRRVTHLEERAYPDLQPDPDPPKTVVAYDDCSNPDPLPLWGSLDAEHPSRHQRVIDSGGTWRRLIVAEGDNYYGERAELGRNSDRDTFCVYREGDIATTSLELRLPEDFPIDGRWCDLIQMKQIAGLTGSEVSVGVAMELQVRGDRLYFRTFWEDRFSFAIARGVPIPITIAALYSADPDAGWAVVTVGGEGDTYRGPTLARNTYRGPTLARNTEGAIPSHLRIGVYQDSGRPGTYADFREIKVTR